MAKPFTAQRISELAQGITRQRDVAVKRAALSIVAA